ncbi:MAG TPA: GAF domain-containing protein [Vicinamibacterales bacterium]|jgi:GAF domain-containing protein
MDERIRPTAPPIATAASAGRKAIQQIARHAVPGLADFAVVFVVAGHWIVGIAAAHATPAGARLLRDLQRVYRVRIDDLRSTVAQVVRTGRPALRRTIVHESAPQVPRGSVADIHHRLASRSALVLPIRVGGMVTGAVSLCYAESGRTYAPSDLAAAQRVARQIERTAAPLPHAAPRLRAATGDPRRPATIRRRVVPRN